MSYYEDVNNFWDKYEIPHSKRPEFLTFDERMHRARHLNEEIKELVLAASVEDMVGIADALVDIVYVTIGTAVKMGIPFDECWHAVHKSNMTGKRRVVNANESKRHNPFDVIKTVDWIDPREELLQILISTSDIGS